MMKSAWPFQSYNYLPVAANKHQARCVNNFDIMHQPVCFSPFYRTSNLSIQNSYNAKRIIRKKNVFKKTLVEELYKHGTLSQWWANYWFRRRSGTTEKLQFHWLRFNLGHAYTHHISHNKGVENYWLWWSIATFCCISYTLYVKQRHYLGLLV